jgi:thiamine pyrophosphate-dependent acetolactate synthase large subunit-like protein
MSGRVGVLSLHQGCGLTNAMTGIGEAAKSRTPMIVLAADSPAAALRSNFRVDQEALARSVGAVSERVFSAQSAVADVTRAFRTAVARRRTVVLNVAIDVAAAPATATGPVAAGAPLSPVRPGAEAVAQLAEALRGARKPVFVAGRGARHAGPPIATLAQACGALVATSAVANGLFAEDEFSLGISGGFSSPTGAELIAGADGVDIVVDLHNPGARVVQVDDDIDAIGAHRPVDLGVLGDCAATARDVLAELGRAGARQVSGYRTAEVAARIARTGRWRDVPVDDSSTGERVDPRALTIALDEILPAQRIVSIDSGNFMGYPATHLSVPDENGFCFTQAFQSIGLGLGTAIGAAFARPDRLPVLGTGDGGFLMAIAELETAVRCAIPLVVIVYNDSAYGAEVHHFTAADHGTVTFPETDIAAMAEGFGATGVTVGSVADLAPVREWVEQYRRTGRARPLVLDAKITSDGGAWWLAEAFAGH